MPECGVTGVHCIDVEGSEQRRVEVEDVRGFFVGGGWQVSPVFFLCVVQRLKRIFFGVRGSDAACGDEKKYECRDKEQTGVHQKRVGCLLR